MSPQDLKKWDLWVRNAAPSYPREKVIQFVFREFGKPIEGKPLALDLGCGSGVHSTFLAENGFDVTAVDISEAALDATRSRAETQGLEVELLKQDSGDLDLGKRKFDLIVCTGVLDAIGSEKAGRAVAAVAKMMRPKGRALFIFASDEDFRIEENAPMGLYGYNRDEVEAMFGTRFDRLSIDRYLTTFDNGEQRQSEWLVTTYAD